MKIREWIAYNVLRLPVPPSRITVGVPGDSDVASVSFNFRNHTDIMKYCSDNGLEARCHFKKTNKSEGKIIVVELKVL